MVGTLVHLKRWMIVAFALSSTGLVIPVERSDAATGYDLVVTSVTTNPPTPAVGQQTVFSAVVKNAGGKSTPGGTSWRLSFAVDSIVTNWTTTSGSLPAGGSITLTATTGPSGANYWTATSGTHTVAATADDQNRLPRELSESNNGLTISVTVGQTPPPPPDCRGLADGNIGATRGGLTGFAHGDRYGQLWATEAGFPTGCTVAGCITLSAAATRIPAQLDKWISEWGTFTGPFLFHELQEQPGVTDVEHYFGFIRTDWTTKDPMYAAFRTYAARTN
jgi:CARDB